MWHLIQTVLGLNNPNGQWYLFWSGPAGSLSILAALFSYYRHHKCEICYRWGHPVPAYHRPRCHKHCARTHIDPKVKDIVENLNKR